MVSLLLTKDLSQISEAAAAYELGPLPAVAFPGFWVTLVTVFITSGILRFSTVPDVSISDSNIDAHNTLPVKL